MFPKQNALLGEAIYWTIEIRYPVWESYKLSVNQLDGLKATVADSKFESSGNEVKATYLLRLTPESLNISGTPSVIISDDRGQSSVLNGKSIVVRSVSGESMDIQQPSTPQFRSTNSGIPYFHIAAIALLLLLFVYLRIKRKHAASPKQVLLRQLRRIASEIKQQRFKNAPVLARLLRSELIWGLPADAMTSAELKSKADNETKRSAIADALESLDSARFSGDNNLMNRDLSIMAVHSAIELLDPKQRVQNDTAAVPQPPPPTTGGPEEKQVTV